MELLRGWLNEDQLCQGLFSSIQGSCLKAGTED